LIVVSGHPGFSTGRKQDMPADSFENPQLVAQIGGALPAKVFFDRPARPVSSRG